MASHKKMQAPATKATPEEIMKIYSGVGKTFRVKFVGSENIKEKGDAIALSCLKSLKTAQQQLGYHKPKAVLGLNTKGLSLFDERTKANTRVAISKVSHLTHDPEDICYFGVVVMTSESSTGLKLYAFKAERQVAMQFNQSSKELFDLMFRLREAKRKIRERREQEAAAATAAAAATPAPKVVAGVEAPPDYHAAVDFQMQDENPPPVPPRQSRDESGPIFLQDGAEETSIPVNDTEKRRQKAINEWSKLESELDDIAKDLNLDTNSAQQATEGDQLYSSPDKERTLNSSGVFSDELLSLDLPSPTGWSQFDTTKATAVPFTSTPATAGNPVAAQASVSLQLNPFSAQQMSPSSFNSGMSTEFSNPAYQSGNVSSPEPNITMDLLDNVLTSPPQVTTMQQPTAFGLPFGQKMVASGPMVQPMGFQNPFQQQQASSNDLLSSPASDNFMAFSQPLQPASAAPEQTPGPPPKVDAFADLLTIAKKTTPELASSATPPPKNQPKAYVSMNKMASIKDRPLPPVPGQPTPSDPFGMPIQSISAPTGLNFPPSNVDPAFGTSGGQLEEVYDDFDFGMPTTTGEKKTTTESFNDNFGTSAATTNKGVQQTGWVGFDEETKGQWL